MPCSQCNSTGRRMYPNTGTYLVLPGFMYGQMATQDVCNTCWGSADETNPGPNLVLFHDLRQAQAKLDSVMKHNIGWSDDHATELLKEDPAFLEKLESLGDDQFQAERAVLEAVKRLLATTRTR